MLGLLKILIVYEGCITIKNIIERHTSYNQAREYCDQIGKPLLRIGMKQNFWEPPNGDVTLDIDPIVLNIEGGVLGDERQMPFSDKEFGVAFNEHTLEHLYSAEDVEMAVNECVRVADKAILLAPSPYSITGNLFNPTHHLRLWFDQTNNRILVKENKFRTGFGYNHASEFDYVNKSSPGIGQALVLHENTKVISML